MTKNKMCKFIPSREHAIYSVSLADTEKCIKMKKKANYMFIDSEKGCDKMNNFELQNVLHEYGVEECGK